MPLVVPMSITVLFPLRGDMLDTLKRMLKLPSADGKVLLELHEPLPFTEDSLRLPEIKERCTKNRLYDPFMNFDPDIYPSEISFAVKHAGEWFVSYYPAINYLMTEEFQNLVEVREMCRDMEVPMLGVVGSKRWMKVHGYEDDTDRGFIAKVRLERDLKDRVELVGGKMRREPATGLQAGSFVQVDILSNLCRTLGVSPGTRRMGALSYIAPLMREEVISRRMRKDIVWSISVAEGALWNDPEDVDTDTFMSILEDLRDIFYDYTDYR